MIEELLERIAIALEKLAGDAPEVLPGKAKVPVQAQAQAEDAEETRALTEDEQAAVAAATNGTSKDDLRAALTAFQKEHGRDPTKALIEPFGATIGKIKPADYEKVLEAIEAHPDAA